VHASLVVNCQAILTCAWLRSSSQAVASRVSVSTAGIRRARHCYAHDGALGIVQSSIHVQHIFYLGHTARRWLANARLYPPRPSPLSPQLTHRHMADVLDIAQFHHPVGQQAQCPAAMSRWRVTAGQHGEPGLDLARELGLCTRAWLVVQGSTQATFLKTETLIPDRTCAGQRCSGNLPIRAFLTLTTVGQKQDTRSGMGAGGCVASTDSESQFCTLLSAKRIGVCLPMHISDCHGPGGQHIP